MLVIIFAETCRYAIALALHKTSFDQMKNFLKQKLRSAPIYFSRCLIFAKSFSFSDKKRHNFEKRDEHLLRPVNLMATSSFIQFKVKVE